MLIRFLLTGVLFASVPFDAFASEADLVLPSLSETFTLGATVLSGRFLLGAGMLVCLAGAAFGLWEYSRIKAMPVHKVMRDVSSLIYETCKTYLFQQMKLLGVLEIVIGACLFYYFYVLRGFAIGRVGVIFLWSLLGIAGSVAVAWFGILINNDANCRTAFASLKGKPDAVMQLPLRSGMSIGVLLICIELMMMLYILLFVSPSDAGSCFIGFAIGESLGASVLRICGGIFTKIADIGADLMKIFLDIKEDDARNPGVVADCTGDNAGDSVGPTADGFET